MRCWLQEWLNQLAQVYKRNRQLQALPGSQAREDAQRKWNKISRLMYSSPSGNIWLIQVKHLSGYLASFPHHHYVVDDYMFKVELYIVQELNKTMSWKYKTICDQVSNQNYSERISSMIWKVKKGKWVKLVCEDFFETNAHKGHRKQVCFITFISAQSQYKQMALHCQ
jgi:hypothetical protein